MLIMEILHIILWISTFLATIHGCSKKKRPSQPKPKPALINGKKPAPVAAKKGSDGEKKSKEKEMKSKEETKSKEKVKKPPMDFSEALKHEKTYNRDLTVEEVNKTVEQKPEPPIVLKPKGSTTTAKEKRPNLDPTINTIENTEDELVPKKRPQTDSEEERSLIRFIEKMDPFGAEK
ncbi:uncharacterized protein CELE_D2062.13 [Caenorhabditis elegans]|uniref:Uncharacterized protein n=1 Tax=Caenorhabditis elegans TaxID=6239 RepID=C7IVR0_CAEEL|nr:Uncharacterized protein CELE_D2062.13 [Caenorhabditis elegans]CCD68446.1 Uncharacterized protein CELE_D2062.13 [Caenorhabditis elegans]|eukprot:NP_001254055.1 Uncharacterized protein CELE_D2062.13 [Caenorhabditis elegans]